MIPKVSSSPAMFQPYIKSKTDKSQSAGFEAMPNSSASVQLDKNALVSAGARIPSGGMMSASVIKSESYSIDNPVMIVKGTDDNGRPFEAEVHINDVNPKNASFIEMFALDGYFAANGKSSSVTRAAAGAMAAQKASDGNNSSTKFDFITPLLEHFETQRINKNWEGYSWLRPIVDTVQNYIAQE
jgi:hypothetical protein